jgi:hypothetical protein
MISIEEGGVAQAHRTVVHGLYSDSKRASERIPTKACESSVYPVVCAVALFALA